MGASSIIVDFHILFVASSLQALALEVGVHTSDVLLAMMLATEHTS